MIDARQLRSFLAIVDEKTFNAAARRLGVRQPSLSQQIARLEDDVGEALFDRVGSGVVLTRAGQLLEARARQILAMLEETKRAVREDLDAGKGVVSIGAIPTIAPYLMPCVLRQFRAQYPHTEVRFVEATTGRLTDMVANAEVELAVVATDIDDDRVSCEHIARDPLLLALPEGSPYASLDRICQEHIEQVGVVVLGELHCLGDQVRSFCRHTGIARQIRMHAGQLETALGFVRSGLGMTLVPQMAVAQGDPAGIVTRPVVHGDPSRPIGLIWNAGRYKSGFAREFASIIREHCLQLVEPERATA